MDTRMLLSAIVLLIACEIPPRVPTVDPIPGRAACEAAGDRLAQLKCPEAFTPMGSTFAVACREAAKDGRNWHAECLAKIESCAEVPAAYRGKLCR